MTGLRGNGEFWAHVVRGDLDLDDIERRLPGSRREALDVLPDVSALIAEVRRLEADLASERATNAELRRQLAGAGGLLGEAETKLRAIRDLCDEMDASADRRGPPLYNEGRRVSALVMTDSIRAVLGAVWSEREG